MAKYKLGRLALNTNSFEYFNLLNISKMLKYIKRQKKKNGDKLEHSSALNTKSFEYFDLLNVLENATKHKNAHLNIPQGNDFLTKKNDMLVPCREIFKHDKKYHLEACPNILNNMHKKYIYVHKKNATYS